MTRTSTPMLKWLSIFLVVFGLTVFVIGAALLAVDLWLTMR